MKFLPSRRNHLGLLLLLLLTLVTADDEPIPIPDPFSVPIVAATRSQRFPSKEDRVRLYMSNWYAPPCSLTSKVLYRYNHTGNWTSLWIKEPSNVENSTEYIMDSLVEPDKAFFVDRNILLDCMTDGNGPYKDRVIFRHNMQLYCGDVVGNMFTAWDHTEWESPTDNVPLLLQFGDLRYSHVYRDVSLPLIKKFRSATTRNEIARVTAKQCVDDNLRSSIQTPHSVDLLQPVVWKLATHRHYGLLARTYSEDTPWSEKSNMAVFLGQLTGSHMYSINNTDLENCLNMMRCRLVYNHANSTYVHAKLTSARGKIPEVLNGVSMLRSKVTIQKLLQFKGIIMLEGNDVASGLKWALLSQSVVLMPRPTHTSWAMEELLEPWVHYIPLNDNVTDVEQKMKWVVDHDEAAQRIAERATLWMEDLVMHPDAAEDDRWIQEEILRRYKAHFQSMESTKTMAR